MNTTTIHERRVEQVQRVLDQRASAERDLAFAPKGRRDEWVTDREAEIAALDRMLVRLKRADPECRAIIEEAFQRG